MIFGFAARQFRPYEQEVEFARMNGFEFLQIWYDKNGIFSRGADEQVEIIKQCGYPAIIHALLDINEIEEHVPKLINMLQFLEHTEVIIHPVCKSEKIETDTIFKLANKISGAMQKLYSEGITLYLENNSKLDPIYTTAREVEIMYKENPALEFLLDVAHIDDYKHLQEMIQVRMPKILHAADRHLEVIHEHLPIGQGNIDFEYVFRNILHEFAGRIVLEISYTDKEILDSKARLEQYLHKK